MAAQLDQLRRSRRRLALDLANKTVNIDLDPGETVTCTFIDAKPATLTLIQRSLPEDPQDFAYQHRTVILDDSARDDRDDFESSVTFIDLGPSITDVDQAVPPGWPLMSIECIDPTGNTTSDLPTATALVTIDAGEDIVCIFTNQRHPRRRFLSPTPPPDADCPPRLPPDADRFADAAGPDSSRRRTFRPPAQPCPPPWRCSRRCSWLRCDDIGHRRNQTQPWPSWQSGAPVTAAHPLAGGEAH